MVMGCFLMLTRRHCCVQMQIPSRSSPMTYAASATPSVWRKPSAPSAWRAAPPTRTPRPSWWATAGSWSGSWSLPFAIEVHGTGQSVSRAVPLFSVFFFLKIIKYFKVKIKTLCKPARGISLVGKKSWRPWPELVVGELLSCDADFTSVKQLMTVSLQWLRRVASVLPSVVLWDPGGGAAEQAPRPLSG